MISIILAKSNNNIIGLNGRLPWPTISADMKWFKKHTIGKAVVMGRTTYESISKALPNRVNVVLTRDLDYAPLDTSVIICHSIGEVIERFGTDEIMVIGGAEIYKQFYPLATKIYLTTICHDFDGDVRFEINLDESWKELYNNKVNDKFELEFRILERK